MTTSSSRWLSAPGWTTAHLAREGQSGERPLTVCGRVMRRPFPVGASFARCHYCQTMTTHTTRHDDESDES